MSMFLHDDNGIEPYDCAKAERERVQARYNTMLKTAFDFVLEATDKDLDRLRRWIEKHRPKN